MSFTNHTKYKLYFTKREILFNLTSMQNLLKLYTNIVTLCGSLFVAKLDEFCRLFERYSLFRKSHLNA